MLSHSNPTKLLFLGEKHEQAYLQQLKSCVGTTPTAVLLQTPTTFYELRRYCEEKKVTGIFSTSSELLYKLLESNWTNTRKRPSIDNYAGSLFTHQALPGIEIVFINPLDWLIKVSYGRFLATHYISKLTKPEAWFPSVEFNWSVFNGDASFISRWSESIAIATDIETFSNPPSIRCVGYTAVFAVGGNWSTESIVIPLDSIFNLSVVRQVNDLPVAKIFQNGKYDIAYLQSYNAAPIKYLWDTAEMMHSWYAELPKDLASLNSFFVRQSRYWKDLADTTDLHEYYRYNALDTHATAMVFLAWMRDAPQWAKNNYANTFPLQFPCHLSEMTGIALDSTAQAAAQSEQNNLIATLSTKLNTMLGTTAFNVNSPIQMKQLLKILGCGDLESADEKNLAKAMLRHPINHRIIGLVIKIRKARKLVSTYLTPGKEFYGHLGQYKLSRRPRILYSLNPHGTDTGRLASKEHHFWCGLQVQNIPRGTVVKRTLVADDGFYIAECDLEQAESRDTAHIAGDESLIAAVSSSRDFHSVNASAFFGVPYDSIYSTEKSKVINKPLRDLAKRVNHGANYNMGANVLVDTMGLDNIWNAQRILKLPKLWTPKQVAEHLLAVFHRTYPAISHIYYPGVIHEVKSTHMLSSKATHHVEYQASPQALVRYCFGNPEKNKSDLNAYVAHPPQSLNAMTLNRAFMKVFYDIAINPKFSNDFKLLCQIHDSILFQYRVGRDDIPELVVKAMQIPVTVSGYDGTSRTFTVPAALKDGNGSQHATNWGETE